MKTTVSTRRSEDERSARGFGGILSFLAAVVALLPLISGGSPRLALLLISTALAALSLFLPSLLVPATRLWVRFGERMARITNPLILGTIYFALICPMAIFYRFSRNASFKRRLEPELPSYWVKRNPPGPEPGSITRQF